MAGARRHTIQRGYISLCHPGHSPLTQLSAPPLPEAPSLKLQLSLPRIGAFQPDRMPGWSPIHLNMSTKAGGRKMQKNAVRTFEYNVSLDDSGMDVTLTCH